MSAGITITFPDQGFERWEDLHKLLTSSFSFMDGRIDPPSSLSSMQVDDLKTKAQSEWLGTVLAGADLIGCAFVRAEPGFAYVGKVAIAPDWQGLGLSRRLFGEIEKFVVAQDLNLLELQTRIELTENHAVFAKLGFERVGETAHPGYDRPTSITMQKRL